VNDRRISERIAVALRAQYRSHGVVVDGVVADLSRTGMFLRTDAAEALGTRGLIEVDLPGSSEPLRLDADVVRIADGEGRGLGLRFSEVGVQARRPLANLMMHWAHASAP